MYIRLRMDRFCSTKQIKVLLLPVLLFSLFIQGCSILPKEDDVIAPPLIKPVNVTYDLYEVKRQTIKLEAKGSGTFIYDKRSSLSYKYSGSRLKALYVSLGDKVTKGMLVAELENESLLDMIKQTEMEYQKAELRLELIEIDKQARLAGPDPSPSELEKADINIKLQQLEVSSIEYKLTNLKRDYDRTRLISTLDGIVTYVLDAKQGDIIQPYTTLVEVADPGRLILDWQYSDTSKMQSLHNGMEVDISIDSVQYKGKIIATPVDFIDEKDSSKYQYTIRIKVEGLPEDISAGQNASISATLQKKDDVLVIPKDALRTEIGGTYVLILKDSLKRERKVETGLVTATQAEILNGLEEGEQVILR